MIELKNNEPELRDGESLDAVKMPPAVGEDLRESTKSQNSTPVAADSFDLSTVGYSAPLMAIATGYRLGKMYYDATQNTAQKNEEQTESGDVDSTGGIPGTEERPQSGSWYDSILGAANTAWSWLSGGLSLEHATDEQKRQLEEVRASVEKEIGEERTTKVFSDVRLANESLKNWKESADSCVHEIESQFEELKSRVEATLETYLKEKKLSELSVEQRKFVGYAKELIERLDEQIESIEQEEASLLADLRAHAGDSPEAAAALRKFIAQCKKSRKDRDESRQCLDTVGCTLEDPESTVQDVGEALEQLGEVRNQNAATIEQLRTDSETILDDLQISDKEKSEIRGRWQEAARLTDKATERVEHGYVAVQQEYARLLVDIAREENVDLGGYGRTLLEVGAPWAQAVAVRWTVGMSNSYVEEKYAKLFMFVQETEDFFAALRQQMREAYGPSTPEHSFWASRTPSFLDETEESDKDESAGVLQHRPIAEAVVLGAEERIQREKLLAKLDQRGIKVRGRAPSQAEERQADVAQNLVDNLV